MSMQRVIADFLWSAVVSDAAAGLEVLTVISNELYLDFPALQRA